MSHLAIWEMEGEKMAGGGACMLSNMLGLLPCCCGLNGKCLSWAHMSEHLASRGWCFWGRLRKLQKVEPHCQERIPGVVCLDVLKSGPRFLLAEAMYPVASDS